MITNEVDVYKYLGVHISKNLTDHHHASELIKKGNRLIGYIKSIIDNQDDFNRVYYGNILWKSLALPMINYACAISCFSDNDYKKNSIACSTNGKGNFEGIQKHSYSSSFR